MNVLGKDYDTERHLFGGNGYRDSSDACTVEISIDSQLGRIPSVVSTPVTSQPYFLRLRPHSPSPSSYRPFVARSPFSFCSISQNGFLHNGALI